MDKIITATNSIYKIDGNIPRKLTSNFQPTEVPEKIKTDYRIFADEWDEKRAF